MNIRQKAEPSAELFVRGACMNSYLSSFIGKVILFRVLPQFLQEARSIIQPHNPAPLLYGKLLAIDGIGCWVENPSWSATDTKTQTTESYLAHILIPWTSIISAAAFPDRGFPGVPESEDGSSIGFLSNL